MPPSYAQALARLQDDVEPFEFPEVEKIIAEEPGVRLSKPFAHIEQRPLAAASIAHDLKVVEDPLAHTEWGVRYDVDLFSPSSAAR